MLRPRAALLLALSASASFATPRVARADEPPPRVDPPPESAEAASPDLARLILDDGRIPVPAAEEGLIRFRFNGEYQLRVNRMQSFPLARRTASSSRIPARRATRSARTPG
jgi:hypothetical protein